MRRVLILWVGFLFFFACKRPSAGTADAKLKPEGFRQSIVQIRLLLDSQQAAWNRGSITDFMKGYWESDSLRFISKRGIRYGYDSVQASYLRNYSVREKMGQLRFEELDFQALDPDTSLINACGRWKISGRDSASGFFSLLFRKIRGEWKITTDHTW